ncbi:PREDICTED: kinesin-like protein KIN-14J [Ipomoea nil]|uniref:kinesin-like protein KIN-14J n=1 Tax=Ipomoea nil TaxID=35883 RepID=UPI000900F334|nr:PREDICTED: kinesin-like protein KIN-14J [Ipomoea nil]
MNTESEMPGAEKGEQANINAFRSFNASEQIDCFNNMAKELSASNNHAGSKLPDVFQLKIGCEDILAYKISELMKQKSLESASTRLLFSAVGDILNENIERKNGDIPQCVSSLLKLVLQEIEQRVSKQSENLRKQHNSYKSREQKYQLKDRAYEALRTGAAEEHEIEKAKSEEKEKHREQIICMLQKDKDHHEMQISSLNHELELCKKTYEGKCLQLETHLEKMRIELGNKIMELECLLTDSKKKADELEAFSESKLLKWKRKEHVYKHFIESQSGSIQALRMASESLKQDVLRTKEIYAEELYNFGFDLKGLIEAAQNYHTVLEDNRKLYNEVQDLKGNIRVYCRIRPFLPDQNNKRTTMDYIGENGELVVVNPLKHGKDSHRLFKFNKVFGPTATQEEVFRDTQPLIRSVLDGYNVCIFAYGQTGSGKTYTMSGPSMSSMEDWGVNYRALNDLFHISQSRKGSIVYEVGVQMVEIYNEQVRDLLCTESSQKRLGIWNTTQPNGLAVPDASMHPVKSTADVLELMSIGLMNRAVGATALNERSSRSHSVLTVHVRGTDLETNEVLRGCLHLVDLAGSERIDRSEATGERLREAQHINKSLSALGDVIFALAHKSNHVPYRNSKLTQVLQSSLGGQAKTLMFVQLNPDVESYSETVSTLKFAERVSGVELGAAKSNKEGRGVKELMDQVAFLKETIAKKDEEIGRLRLRKTNTNGERHGMGPLKNGSASPRRYSLGGPRQSSKGGERSSRLSEKAASDRSSEYSDRLSEAGSQQSMDEFRHHSEFFRDSRFAVVSGGQNFGEVDARAAVADGGQNCNEDTELIGFGGADSEERLSDISDSVLSMGTETESTNSIVEHTLFPEVAKPPSDATEKPRIPTKLQRFPEKQTAKGSSSRMSLNKTATKVSSSKKSTASSSSAVRPPRRWQ